MTCSVKGCHNRRIARGYCSMHYKRAVKHGDPLGDRPPLGVFPRPCKVCGAVKTAEEFEEVRNTGRAPTRRHTCRSCYALERAARTYNVSIEEIEVLIRDQAGRCRICGQARPLCIDHDHETGRVRGLLCQPCNHGVGNFRDDPALLAAAADYLARSLAHPGERVFR